MCRFCVDGIAFEEPIADTDSDFLPRVEAVRRSKRFYTRQIGLLQEGLLHSLYPLTEALQLGQLQGARVVEVLPASLTLEMSGASAEVSWLVALLRPFGAWP